MNTFSIEENEYLQIFVDVTKKCNMNCNVCYQGDKKNNKEFLDINYFEEVCKLLPKKVVFRLTGGEATLHPNLVDIVRIGGAHGNFMTLVTNGTMIAGNLNYVLKLKKAARFFMAGITLDGGFHNRDVYKLISNQDIMDTKLRALETLFRAGVRRTSAGMIIIKGMNEDVIDDLLQLADTHKSMRYLFIRPLAPIGNFVGYETYSVEETFEIVKERLKEKNKKITRMVERTPYCKDCRGCLCFIVDGKYQIGITDMSRDQCRNCRYRGKLKNDYKIVPFFVDLTTF